MTSVSEPIGSCMSYSMTWTLLNVLISSGSAGSTMDEDVPQRRMFDAVVGSHRRKGRLRTRWKDQVREPLNSIGVTNWRRGEWSEALRQAETR